MDMIERINGYTKSHCWQYDIRMNNCEEDLAISGLTVQEIKNLRISDFTFESYTSEAKKVIWKEVKTFIERHEWLGKMSLYPTHIFTARYKGIL